jgi:predicted nucleotidyltransferase
LKKYKEIDDIVVFGSFVKDKFQPNDIDLAVISEEKSIYFAGKISSELPKNAHMELLSSKQIYQTRVGISIILEGFSIKHNKFLRDILGISPKKIYVYEIRNLKPSEKRQFNRALLEHLKTTRGDKLGAGSVMIPTEKSGFFDDFLERWNLKFNAKSYNVW